MRRMIVSTALSALVALAAAGLALADGTNRATKVLTPELAQKILGGPVEANPNNAQGDTENGKTWVSRAYYSLKTSGGKSPQVGLLIRHGTDKAQSKSIFESSKSTFSGVDVAGLGAPAYRTKTPAQLNVLKGVNWLIISAGTFSAPDTAKQEQTAKEIIGKLAED